MWFISLIIFIFILGIIVLVHEFGHFICAKKSGVHIYEFSIGMGPLIYSHKGKKDGILYNIRAFPIGGYVSMAGEIYDDIEGNDIKKDELMCNKPWYKRVIILLAGIFNNFVLGIVILLILSIFFGSMTSTLTIDHVDNDSAVEKAGIMANDKIVSIDDRKVDSWDVAIIYLNYKKNDGESYKITVLRDNKELSFDVVPSVIKTEDGNERKSFGLNMYYKKDRNALEVVTEAFTKFGNIIKSMIVTLGGLFTGKISLNNLSGPVGIYKVVDEAANSGLAKLLYIMAYLSINVGFINLLPFPAFDGGHVFYMVIELITRKKMNQKIEGIINTIGFILLMILMVIITIKDIFTFII